MARYLFDIETDGLLLECTTMWVLIATDIDTGDVYTFKEGDTGWIELFNKATLIVGHNILGFDVIVLKKLYGYEFPASCKFHDTLVLSRVLNYKRFPSNLHRLEEWGLSLGFPKIVFNDWSKYSEEMRIYCERDVSLNLLVYRQLMKELSNVLQSMADNNDNPEKLKHYLRAEQAAAVWCAEATLAGWPFDLDAAKVLLKALEAQMNKAYEALSARLGLKTIAYDRVKGVVETKKPKWTSHGFYDAHTCRWFNIEKFTGYEGEERMVEGEYCRVVFEPLSLDSVADVKTFLFRNGWQPTEWNMKVDPDTGKKEKGSPKITEDSLEFLGGDGKLYTEFLTAKSRYGILKTWLENTDAEGNLHGDCVVIGTPSMRARHSIIVNVPSSDSPWGKEMRSLFIAKPGWKLIGCDSSGNQARGLAHYLGDAQFIDTLLNGDIHQFNADILTEIVRKLPGVPKDFVVKRSQAKRILYAFLFGASGSKLWSYIFGVLNEPLGKRLKNEFIKAVPGFKALLTKLENIYGKTSQYGHGYIPSIAGNRVYVDSFHKLLVYLLQAAEKVTCSTALMVTAENLKAEGIPYIPCIFYHDEIDFMVPEQFAARAAEIGKASFKDGPKLYGIQIMDGDAKIGNSWYDVH